MDSLGQAGWDRQGGERGQGDVQEGRQGSADTPTSPRCSAWAPWSTVCSLISWALSLLPCTMGRELRVEQRRCRPAARSLRTQLGPSRAPQGPPSAKALRVPCLSSAEKLEPSRFAAS